MALFAASNGSATTVKSDGLGRLASDYSELQSSRLDVSLPLPSVLKNSFNDVDGPPSSGTGDSEDVPQPVRTAVSEAGAEFWEFGAGRQEFDDRVVLSGGQAPGGHNVISGIFDYLQQCTKGSKLYGFRGGPAEMMKCKYVELSTEFIYPYRNQGGFDMICSGRDKIETPEQIHAEMIGNVMVDACSTGKYYHFVRLMGRAASQITLECALQNADSSKCYDYWGREGLIDFIPEVLQLGEELNEILAHDIVDEAGTWKKKLRIQSQELFELFPKAIQKQLLLERDHKGMCSYEGSCGLPTNFDANYCYALDSAARVLLHSGKTY
ncbi:hypothetical protein Ddye_016545 [Dipteronia dyeriana]|uniref:Diphosphate--fructose-6-phosphate 1-phosphotransferase n=1 Tax=Dipteronia dyeriana TaxID=168575 RepID=A0AAD9U7L5_9ROSI|nr:hypothetical protein Ddye_016545 [Dipteronia dyeriana]